MMRPCRRAFSIGGVPHPPSSQPQYIKCPVSSRKLDTPNWTARSWLRAVFTEAYAVIPGSVMRDIVASALPFWNETRAWIVARPLSGFAETFSQYIMEVGPGGGSEQPE